MANKLSNSPIDDLFKIAATDEFKGLDKEIQTKIIQGLSDNKNKDQEGGFMGKIFGTNKDNAVIHIALTVIILLASIGAICMLCGHDLWNVIIPSIMTAVGYMFGHGEKN